MSRRFVLYNLPVAHINGKMAGQSVIVHNQPDTDISPVSFMYGYKRGRDISRVAWRVKARNLSVKPYLSDEQQNKADFRAAVIATDNYLRGGDISAAVSAFKAQKKYVSFRNFIIAKTLFNGGIVPF